MKDLFHGLIGVLLGLSLVINGALIYNAINNGTIVLPWGNEEAAQEEQTPASGTESSEQADAPVQSTSAQAPQQKTGLALFTSANAPAFMNENLFGSIHSMVYDNEAVFYIPYSDEVAASEAGYNENRADYQRILADLWDQNRNQFLKKNKEFSSSMETYQTDAYCTFIIVDDDNHDNILAIISDGVVYYDIAKHQGLDPFSLYDTRWNKYIRRDLSQILDDPNQAYVSPYRTQKGVIERNTDRVLYDNGNIRILETGYGKDGLGWKLNLLIENHSFTDIRVECQNTSLNRYMMPSLFYADVLSGKDKVDAIYFTNEQLQRNEIGKVLETGFSFIIYEKGTDRVLATSDLIRLDFE